LVIAFGGHPAAGRGSDYDLLLVSQFMVESRLRICGDDATHVPSRIGRVPQRVPQSIPDYGRTVDANPGRLCTIAQGSRFDALEGINQLTDL
jgi:hypothetical protein